MARRKRAQSKQTNQGDELNQEVKSIIQNGLADAVLGGDLFSQLSQSDTMFKNNRWYLISNMRQLLSQIYVEHGLIQTIVDIPVEDAFSKGFEIKTDLLEPDEISDLEAFMEAEGDLITLGQAMKWNRLYGGAGVVLKTDQKPDTAFKIESIKQDSKLGFRAADLWELHYSKQQTESDDIEVDLSKKTDYSSQIFNFYSMKLHQSRVLKLKGIKAPSFVEPRLRGWGLSVVESIVRSVNQYFKSNSVMFEILDEFKIDVFKIEGLSSTLLEKEGSRKVHDRVALANREKNYHHAITMDAKDDYQQKQLAFTGFADAMREIRMQVSADLRMPQTKLFGMSSAGFNSGEDDIEVYNAMVEGQVRQPSKPILVKMVKARCMQLYGMIPEDLEVTFPSMRSLSSEQEETVKTQKFNRILQAFNSGAITLEEFRQACAKDDLITVASDNAPTPREVDNE